MSFATKNVIAVGCGAGSYMIEKLARFGPASLRLSVSALLAALEAAPPCLEPIAGNDTTNAMVLIPESGARLDEALLSLAHAHGWE